MRCVAARGARLRCCIALVRRFLRQSRLVAAELRWQGGVCAPRWGCPAITASWEDFAGGPQKRGAPEKENGVEVVSKFAV